MLCHKPRVFTYQLGSGNFILADLSRSFPSGGKLVQSVGKILWSRFITVKIDLKCLT